VQHAENSHLWKNHECPAAECNCVHSSANANQTEADLWGDPKQATGPKTWKATDDSDNGGGDYDDDNYEPVIIPNSYT
jgi:hypothetical protein